MISELLLLSGNDLPFPEGKLTIHQPTLKEIAYIGEETFLIGCGFLDFSKKILSSQDKINLENYDDFDIFMSIMISKEREVKRSVECAGLVLSLIFPLYSMQVRSDAIVFIKEDNSEGMICKNNFAAFKKILQQMFNLNMGKEQNDKYKPAGSMAQRIAEKFKKRHETLLKLKNNNDVSEKSINILSRYVSILAVGEQKDLNDLMQYTIYQLYDEFQRYQLKVQWDAYIQARMAGAKDLDEVDNWMIDLKDQKKKEK